MGFQKGAALGPCGRVVAVEMVGGRAATSVRPPPKKRGQGFSSACLVCSVAKVWAEHGKPHNALVLFHPAPVT